MINLIFRYTDPSIWAWDDIENGTRRSGSTEVHCFLILCLLLLALWGNLGKETKHLLALSGEIWPVSDGHWFFRGARSYPWPARRKKDSFSSPKSEVKVWYSRFSVRCVSFLAQKSVVTLRIDLGQKVIDRPSVINLGLQPLLITFFFLLLFPLTVNCAWS
jgi:hypothetical protein